MSNRVGKTFIFRTSKEFADFLNKIIRKNGYLTNADFFIEVLTEYFKMFAPKFYRKHRFLILQLKSRIAFWRIRNKQKLKRILKRQKRNETR